MCRAMTCGSRAYSPELHRYHLLDGRSRFNVGRGNWPPFVLIDLDAEIKGFPRHCARFFKGVPM
jgi:hypothetical protein